MIGEWLNLENMFFVVFEIRLIQVSYNGINCIIKLHF